MIGVVDTGGGMRDIFGAGVFDYFIEKKINFDYCIGVSAGSANIASFLAGQHYRNHYFYCEYSFRKEYMSLSNMIKDGSYIDLDYIYGTLSNHDGENPLNYKKIMENPAKFVIVTTDAKTGKPAYFDKSEMSQDNYDIIKASCAVPLFAAPYKVDGKLYYDGGLSDPIPYKKVFEANCDKVVVIITRPKDYRRNNRRDVLLSHRLKKTYPNTVKSWRKRGEIYNRQLDELIQLEKEGRALILAPKSIGKMKTLTKDKEMINSLYQQGKKVAEKIEEFI